MEDKPKRIRETHGEHRQGRRFSNPYRKGIRRKLHHLFLWQLGYYNDDVPLVEAPSDFVYPIGEDDYDPTLPEVTWINHSTFIVEIDGLVFLTDPIWNERASPLKFLGPKRQHPPSVPLDQLPRIDYVLISHNHYDHLDLYTVKRLISRFPDICWYVPLGIGKWLHKAGAKHVVELDWWEMHTVPGIPKLEVHAVPAQHYSGRGLFDYNTTLWAGWVIRVTRPDGSQKQFYFVGDTGYNDIQFKEIGHEFHSMDLSLIPIGVYRPAAFMNTVHVNPAEAVEIHLDVHSQLSIGTHWGTFRLSSEPRNRPPYDLYRTMQDKNLSLDTFRVLTPGHPINW
jgi:N-acyl-phosphatidylethanolamine-hydrolysing phospholipase D